MEYLSYWIVAKTLLYLSTTFSIKSLLKLSNLVIGSCITILFILILCSTIFVYNHIACISMFKFLDFGKRTQLDFFFAIFYISYTLNISFFKDFVYVQHGLFSLFSLVKLVPGSHWLGCRARRLGEEIPASFPTKIMTLVMSMLRLFIFNSKETSGSLTGSYDTKRSFCSNNSEKWID